MRLLSVTSCLALVLLGITQTSAASHYNSDLMDISLKSRPSQRPSTNLYEAIDDLEEQIADLKQQRLILHEQEKLLESRLAKLLRRLERSKPSQDPYFAAPPTSSTQRIMSPINQQRQQASSATLQSQPSTSRSIFTRPPPPNYALPRTPSPPSPGKSNRFYKQPEVAKSDAALQSLYSSSKTKWGFKKKAEN